MNELIRFFTNLLILQYRNKPKAKATIETLATNLFSNDTDGIFPLDVENAYDLDTASQKQLDVIGKYIGYSSDVDIIVDNNFKYAEYDDSVNPDTGYSEYNGSKESLPYAEYRYTTYLNKILEYGDYTKILGFLSETKNSVLSLGEIDSLLKKYFGDNIYVVEGNKTVEYHFLQEFLSDFTTEDQLDVFVQKYMPKPMGCTVTAVRDPYYINAIPVGGAENHSTGTIFEMTTTDNSVYYKTPIKFNFKEYQYPNIFHSFEVKVRVKMDNTENSCGYWTTLSGDEYISGNTGDLALVKISQYIEMLTGKTDFRQITTYFNYADKWVDITLTLNHKKYGTHTVWAIVECEGRPTLTVNTMWGSPDWVDFTFLYGIAYNYGLRGSIDFMGCSIIIDDEVKWKGYTNKRIQGA